MDGDGSGGGSEGGDAGGDGTVRGDGDEVAGDHHFARAEGAVASGDVAFGRAARDYSRYRATYPDDLFDRLEAFPVGLSAGRVLDLGTGTGFLARGFARRGHDVVGLDVDPALLAEARRADEDEGLRPDYVRARAERTPFPDGAFRVATAGQCWHWFYRERAAAEVRRVLEPGGELVITHFDWLPIDDNVVAATEALIETWNPSWAGGGGDGFYPAWLRDVRQAGFEDAETFTFDVDVAYTHEAWRGRIRASAGVGGSLPDEDVTAFDDALADLLADRFPADPLAVPHRSFTLVCRAPPE